MRHKHIIFRAPATKLLLILGLFISLWAAESNAANSNFCHINRHEDGRVRFECYDQEYRFIEESAIRKVNLNWDIHFVGDMDNDGVDDILWQHIHTGANYVWHLHSNGTIKNETFLPPLTPDWELKGTGTIDDNAHLDFIWRNKITGEVRYWLFNAGGLVEDELFNAAVSQDDEILDVTDINADGSVDIVYQMSNRSVVIWYLDQNATFSADSVANPNGAIRYPSNNWSFVGLHDLNHSLDGNLEILWRHKGSNDLYYWSIDGNATVVDENYIFRPFATKAKLTQAWDVISLDSMNKINNSGSEITVTNGVLQRKSDHRIYYFWIDNNMIYRTPKDPDNPTQGYDYPWNVKWSNHGVLNNVFFPNNGKTRIMFVGDSITNGVQQDEEDWDIGYASFRRNLSQQIGTCNVDFVGSQSTHYRETLPLKFFDYDPDHESYGGLAANEITDPSTTATKYQIYKSMKKYKPDYVVIGLGTNDISRGETNPNAVADSIKLIIDNLREIHPSTSIIMSQIIPTRISAYDPMINDVNDQIENFTTDPTLLPLFVVDHYTQFAPYDIDEVIYDNFHPNNLGEQLMSDKFTQEFNGSIGVCP